MGDSKLRTEKSVKLAWSLGLDLSRVRRVVRARVKVEIGLGLG